MDEEIVLDYSEEALLDDHFEEDKPTATEADAVPTHQSTPKKTVVTTKSAESFGIKPKKEFKVSDEQLNELYADLRMASGTNSTRSALVKGADGLSRFVIEKIFSEFNPYRVESIDDSTALVHFTSRLDTAAMFIGMTKSLRRVRAKKTADEDGEVLSSDEDEEGQLKYEGGDDVAVVEKLVGKPKQNKKDVVEVDVSAINIPDGRWRVVVKHVPEQRLLLARFATSEEILLNRQNRMKVDLEDVEVRKRKYDTIEPLDSLNTSAEIRVRPGLNIFDNEGNELEWDYEHDTRFFESTDDERNTSQEDVTEGLPSAVIVRGRGAKKGKFLYSGGGTLASDRVDKLKLRTRAQREARDLDADDDDSPAPTTSKSSRLTNRLSRV